MLTIRCVLPIIAGLFASSLPAFAQGGADPQTVGTALREGVPALTAPGAIPGSLAVFGDHAFVVMTAREGKNRLPLVAAATWGKGRIVAIGHESFVQQATHDKADERFIENCIVWAGHGRPAPQTLRVGTLSPEMLSALQAADSDAVLLAADDLKDLTARLVNLDVLYLDQAALDDKPEAIRAVRNWVEHDGGGVILAGPGWGWQQVAASAGRGPQALATQQSANLICRDAGIVWTDRMLEPTGDQGAYTADSKGNDTAHAALALAHLTAHAEGKATLSAREISQATAVLAEAAGALPTGDTVFLPRITALCERFAADAIPTKAKPVTTADAFARLKIVLDNRSLERLPAEKIVANPAAVDFPGAVPADAPRIERDVAIDTKRKGWHSTGLYAAPGEVITVVIPPLWAGKGLAVRIGAQTDTLWHLEKWERWPAITRREKLTHDTLRIASAFGGPVYLEVLETAPPGTFTATIRNAVAAPLFTRGKTRLQDWKTVRQAPGPWAELVGNEVTLTVPSAVVRDLNDPEALMAYWDAVADACADFYAVPKEKRVQQRYCVDRQISAGYMHSGYPIMTWEDVAKTFVNLPVLRGPDGLKAWGFYHELGHNFQQPDWTWDGCGEVTNNLFSLYGNEKFNGVTPTYATSHPDIHPEALRKREQKYLRDGAQYEEWTSDPFLALTFFIELRQAFGWEPFTKVFAEYESLSETARPKTDIEKRDQFMVRFSRAVGKNLGPFFVRWGIPTSESARNEIESLPSWLPPDTAP